VVPVTEAVGNDAWSRFWAQRPHIRVGDPCFHCAVPMYPASRRFACGGPAGHRMHGSHGLCQTCYRQMRRGALEGFDADELSTQDSVVT
jgi:hypothetical protein